MHFVQVGKLSAQSWSTIQVEYFEVEIRTFLPQVIEAIYVRIRPESPV